MKEGIHPDNYRTVIFKDLTADWRFLGKSCAESKENEAWEDGNEYPVIKVEVSSASHPFYTGKNTLVDTAGRLISSAHVTESTRSKDNSSSNEKARLMPGFFVLKVLGGVSSFAERNTSEISIP